MSFDRRTNREAYRSDKPNKRSLQQRCSEHRLIAHDDGNKTTLLLFRHSFGAQPRNVYTCTKMHVYSCMCGVAAGYVRGRIGTTGKSIRKSGPNCTRECVYIYFSIPFFFPRRRFRCAGIYPAFILRFAVIFVSVARS